MTDSILRRGKFFPVLIINVFLLMTTLLYGQNQNTVSGTVTDVSGEPLIGVSIILKGTSSGVVTDFDGNYSIRINSGSDILVFSYIGFSNQEIPVKNNSKIDVVMKEDTQLLDEVVVVGYGTQRKSDMTGGISTLDVGKISSMPATSLGQKLQGQISGLNIQMGNTKPGEDQTFRVRGQKSLSGSNDPLIILNGVPFNGNMTEVDYNSVETISVLKDASSAAIYGARAANGVILITTKSGKSGKPAIIYSGYVGVQKAEWLPDLMSGPENIQLLKDWRRTRDTEDTSWNDPNSWLFTALLDNYKNGVEHDWLKATFRTALQQEHQISISGATETANYYLSATYTDQNGIVENTGYKKYNVSSNISQEIGKWLKLGVNLQLIQRDRSGETPTFNYAYRMSPYGNIYDENGKYVRFPMYGETMYYSPFANIDRVYDDISNGAYITSFADVKLPVDGLTYRANLGYSYRQREIGSYYGSTTMTGEPVGGSARIDNNAYGDWTFENILRYDKDFGKNHLDLTGLFSAQETYSTEHSSSGIGFLSDNNAYHNIDMAQGEKNIASDKKETAMLSWMGRLNYSFDRRYLLTLTGRRDGFSAFGEGKNKWGFFPSVATGWVISEEDFFESLSENIDFLKLRASYGKNGNLAVSAYQTKTKLEQNDYIYGNEADFAGGLSANFTMGNPNLRWETTTALNVGLDFNLFGNRISGNIDAYVSNTKDLLMLRTVPVMNGYTSILDNVGATRNRGVDITLNTVNIKTSDFEWATTFVAGGNWNKITRLKDADANNPYGKNDPGNNWFIGEPVRVYYNYKKIGIWQTNETDEMSKTLYFGKNPKPGDPKLKDTTGDGNITADDRVVIGSRNPAWTGGITNNFKYKNVSMSLFLSGAFGAWHENGTVTFERNLFDKNTNYIRGINYWTPENPSNDYTRLGYVNSAVSNFIKANYVRVQDLNFAYQFPASIVESLGIQGLRTYLNVQNLYTFSNAKKFTTNLEYRNSTGDETYSLDSGIYPSQRVFILGVNLTF